MNTRSLLPARLLTVGLLAFAAAAHAQAPANDDFANRQVLPSETQVSVSGTTTGATQEPFEVAYSGGLPYGDGINEKNTVWYDYTAPSSGSLNVDLTRTLPNTMSYVLVVKGGGTPVAANIVSAGYLPFQEDQADFPAPAAITVAAGEEYTMSVGTTPPTPTYDDSFILKLILKPGATVVPSVSLTAPQAQAIRANGQKGEFLFTLSTPATTSLTLGYQVAGNAVGGTDYKLLKGTVVVPAGGTTAKANVKPLAGGSDVNGKPTKVKLILEPGDGYTVGSAGKATVKIYDQN